MRVAIVDDMRVDSVALCSLLKRVCRRRPSWMCMIQASAFLRPWRNMT